MVKKLVQRHTANPRRGWGLNPGVLALELVPLTTTPCRLFLTRIVGHCGFTLFIPKLRFSPHGNGAPSLVDFLRGLSLTELTQSCMVFISENEEVLSEEVSESETGKLLPLVQIRPTACFIGTRSIPIRRHSVCGCFHATAAN